MEASPEACRSCGGTLTDPVLDLGQQAVLDEPLPWSEAASVPLAPLRLALCTSCSLVQPPRLSDASGVDRTRDPIPRYQSRVHGHSMRRPGAMATHLRSWTLDVLTHARTAVNPLVVDVGSGDGALLEHFVAAGLDVLGFESRSDLAEVANVAGIRTNPTAFGMAEATRLAAAGRPAGLVLANHLFAHVENLGILAAAIREILAPDGWLAVEFHDLAALVEGGHFDAISHAHRAYLSLSTLRALLRRHSLDVVAARRSDVYGGSIQVLARSRGVGPIEQFEIERLLGRDRLLRLDEPATFARLGERAHDHGRQLREHLDDAAARRMRVAGYGAPGRAVTLLGVAGVGSRLLPYTVDRDPSKQGLCLPGSGIPVRAVAALVEDQPDEIVVLAWTWADEIRADLIRTGTWKGRLVRPLPDLRVETVG